MTKEYIFWIVALLGSLAYGVGAFKIFKVDAADKGWVWILHQVWFNFVGTIAGWFALWLLWRRVLVHDSPVFGFWDFALGLVVIIGVTGHLPVTLIGFLEAMRARSQKLLDRITSSG